MRTIIFHGWAYTKDKWLPLVDDLKSQGIKAELPDIPVLTESVDAPWMLDDYMGWIKSMVGEDKVNLVGHSNGGRLSLNFASRYPELVEKLILVDSAGIPRTELKSKVKRTVFRTLAKTGKPLSGIKPVRKAFYKVARARDYLEADPIGRETMANLLKSDYSLDLSKIEASTWIIWGRNDGMTPLKDAYTFQKKLTHSHEPFIIDEARHSPQFTHTDEVASYMGKVLK